MGGERALRGHRRSRWRSAPTTWSASPSASRSFLFLVAIGAFTYAFGVGLARSTRGDNVAVANLFFLQGSAPRPVKREFLALFVVCFVITAATVAWEPFGVLVPMLPLGLAGVWAARHGVFPPRPGGLVAADDRRRARADLGRGAARSLLRGRCCVRAVPDVGERGARGDSARLRRHRTRDARRLPRGRAGSHHPLCPRLRLLGRPERTHVDAGRGRHAAWTRRSLRVRARRSRHTRGVRPQRRPGGPHAGAAQAARRGRRS